jgi:ABC-type transport system substrate-binding protein
MRARKFQVGLVVLLLMGSPLVGAEELPLRFGVSRDITTLNPFVSTRSVEHWTRTLVFEPLLLEKDFNPAPYIATSWKISKDGREVTLTLRDDVKFHNGKTVTAEDVKWSIEYVLEPRNRAYGASTLRLVRSVIAQGPHRVTIELQEPYAPILTSLANLQTFPVVPKESLKVGESPDSYPPGTGPYRFVSWKRGQQLALRRFADYWQKGLPKTEEVVLKPVPEPDVRLTSLRAGDVDLIDRIPLQNVRAIQRKEMGHLGVFLATGGGLFGLNFNTSKPPFSDKRVRQAVAYAVDKEEIVQGAFWGLGYIANQKMPEGSPWHFPIAERKRDLEKARQLAREAGYPEGLRARFTVVRGNEETAQIIERQLRHAGIVVELQKLDLATASIEAQEGRHELRTQGGDYDSDPDLTYNPYFHTDKGPRASLNLSHYSNTRLDRLLDTGRVTLDPAKRKAIYREVVEILHEDLPVLWLVMTPYAYAYGPRVRDFETDAQGLFFSGDKGIPFVRLVR